MNCVWFIFFKGSLIQFTVLAIGKLAMLILILIKIDGTRQRLKETLKVESFSFHHYFMALIRSVIMNIFHPVAVIFKHAHPF